MVFGSEKLARLLIKENIRFPYYNSARRRDGFVIRGFYKSLVTFSNGKESDFKNNPDYEPPAIKKCPLLEYMYHQLKDNYE